MKKNKNTECSRKMSGHMKHAAAALMAAVMVLSMAGCIDQSQGQKSSNESAAAAESVISDNEADDDGQSDKSTASDNRTSDDATDAKTLLEINDPKEKAAVEAAKKKVAAMNDTPRIIATSPATADICDKLELDLVGVCSSTVSTIPERYKDLTTVGTAMSPDMEIVACQVADFDRAKAMSVMENILQANPEIDGLYAANDEMLLGALEARDAAGRTADIVKVGCDAIDDTLEAIKDKRVEATIAEPPFFLGKAILNTAYDYLEGKEVEAHVVLDNQLVTQDTVDSLVTKE